MDFLGKSPQKPFLNTFIKKYKVRKMLFLVLLENTNNIV